MSLPRYKFDPVSQRYTLLTPQEEQQKAQQEGGLRAIDSGGDNVSAPSGSRGPGQGISPTAQAIGLGGLAYGNMLGGFMPGGTLANVVGGAVADQQLGALGEAQSNSVADVAAVAEAATDAAPAAAPAADSGGASAAPASDGGGNEFGGDVGSTATGGSDSSTTGYGGSDTGAAEGGWRRGGPIMMSQGGLSSMKRYADGGMTMSPQNYGRMGDSMLVHMNPREVAGLQSLARSQGTSLTVNPQTGYPEAFNLQALLPIAAGLALGPAGYGLTAANAGLATAALGTAATGSLKKGLMAGLGAYGGAGLGEGLVGATGAEATMTPTSPVINPTPPVPGVSSTYSGATPGVTPNTNLGTGGFGGSNIDPYNFANPATVAMPGTVAGSTATIAPGSPLLAPPPVVPPSLQSQISPSSFTPDTALSGVSPTPDKFIGNLSGKDAFKYGTAAVASIPPPEFEPPKSTAMLRPYDYSFNPITGLMTQGREIQVRCCTGHQRLHPEKSFLPEPVG
jgi:hypothetical protein